MKLGTARWVGVGVSTQMGQTRWRAPLTVGTPSGGGRGPAFIACFTVVIYLGVQLNYQDVAYLIWEIIGI